MLVEEDLAQSNHIKWLLLLVGWTVDGGCNAHEGDGVEELSDIHKYCYRAL